MSEDFNDEGILVKIGAIAVCISLIGFALSVAFNFSVSRLKSNINTCVEAGATLENCYNQYAKKE